MEIYFIQKTDSILQTERVRYKTIRMRINIKKYGMIDSKYDLNSLRNITQKKWLTNILT